MGKVNADSILEMMFSNIIIYYINYNLSLQLITLYNGKTANSMLITILISILFAIISILITNKYGYDGIFKLHKVKNINEYLNRLIKFILLGFFLILLFSYCIARLDKIYILIILCLSFVAPYMGFKILLFANL